MTMNELVEQLCEQGSIKPSRAKDLKTSIRYLADAVDATATAITDVESLESSYKSLLKSYFASLKPLPSPYTVRNSLNNLSFLYRTARAAGLIHAVPLRPTTRTMEQSIHEAAHTSPYRERTMLCLQPYRPHVEEWPDAFREPWLAYRASRALTIRPVTIYRYEQLLRAYIGFGVRFDHPPLTAWHDLFEIPRLTRFIQWHTKRVKAPRISDSAYRTVTLLITLAREAKLPVSEALQSLKKRLPQPEPMHNKQHPLHSLTLKELEQVGMTLLADARNPLRAPGQRAPHAIFRVCRHRTALVIRLLVRIPLRIRNICEMKSGQNLFQDHTGTWQIRFQGEELKISQRQGRMNIFQVPFPPDLVEHLEEYLQHYRPLFRNADQYPHLFIGHFGRPFSQSNMGQELRNQVYFHTNGKRFYPHLIRTIWTDAYLLQTHDVSTAAFMLNDRPDTVLQRYHELRANDHIQKAHQFTQSLFG
jgi:hypothetical protein